VSLGLVPNRRALSGESQGKSGDGDSSHCNLTQNWASDIPPERKRGLRILWTPFREYIGVKVTDLLDSVI